MKILVSAAAAAFAITGIQIADKQSDAVPEDVMPEASFSEEVTWANAIEKSDLFCILSLDDANKTEKDKCS